MSFRVTHPAGNIPIRFEWVGSVPRDATLNDICRLIHAALWDFCKFSLSGDQRYADDASRAIEAASTQSARVEHHSTRACSTSSVEKALRAVAESAEAGREHELPPSLTKRQRAELRVRRRVERDRRRKVALRRWQKTSAHWLDIVSGGGWWNGELRCTG